MTHIDNSRIFGKGVYTDADVYVPANTTYKAGTVLGRDADGNLTAYTSEESTPLYVLAQSVTNNTDAAETYDLVRVFDSGEVDRSELVFINEEDAANPDVLDALKINNFRLLNIEELTEETSLSE